MAFGGSTAKSPACRWLAADAVGFDDDSARRDCVVLSCDFADGRPTDAARLRDVEPRNDRMFVVGAEEAPEVDAA